MHQSARSFQQAMEKQIRLYCHEYLKFVICIIAPVSIFVLIKLTVILIKMALVRKMCRSCNSSWRRIILALREFIIRLYLARFSVLEQPKIIIEALGTEYSNIRSFYKITRSKRTFYYTEEYPTTT